MSLDKATAFLNNPAAQMEQRAIMAALETARLLREGTLSYTQVPYPSDVVKKINELHAQRCCIWGTPTYAGTTWVIWYFKPKE